MKTKLKDCLLFACIILASICILGIKTYASDAYDALRTEFSYDKEGHVIGGHSGFYDYWVYSDGTAVIIGYNGNEKDVTVPSYIDGYKVTAIRRFGDFFGNVFSFNSTIESVIIPEGVTELQYCFSGCPNLKTVSLPSTLKIIADRTFENCTALQNISLPSGLTNLGDGAFINCSSLKKITVPAVKNINNVTFYGCTSLSSVKLKNKPERIYDYAFGECTSLTSITIPKSVKYIHLGAFSNCTKLSTVTLYEGIQYIWEDAFNNTAIKSITIPKSVIELGCFCLWTDSLEEIHFLSSDAINIDNAFLPSNVKIFAPSGSYAEKWADENGSDFEIVGSPIAPTLKTATNVNSGIKLTWTTVNHVDGYIIYRKSSDSSYKKICYVKNGTKNYITDTTATAGVTYRYCIRAYVNSTPGNLSNALNCYRLTTPKFTKLSNTSAGISLTWTAVDTATSYYLYRSTNDGAFKKIATVKNTTSYVDKNTVSGNTYTYYVCAVNGGYISNYSTQKSLLRLIAPTIKSITNSDYSINLKWDSVDGADTYIIYRRAGSAKTEQLAIIPASDTEYNDITAEAGILYTYSVVTHNNGTVSTYAASKKCLRIEQPLIISATNSTAGVIIKWYSIDSSTGYYVYRKEAGGSYVKIATLSGNSITKYTDKTAEKGKKYNYVIRAFNSGYLSAWSDVISITRK